MTLFQTIQEVIGRINIGKWIDFHRQRRDAYDPIALLTILLFAYARYGYASLRQLEEMSRYVLRLVSIYDLSIPRVESGIATS